MPRTARVAPAGVIFHVLDRANARARIFEKDLDYEAFRRIIGETSQLIPVEIFASTIMPTHWHMVLRPAIVQFKSRRFQCVGDRFELRPFVRPRRATRNVELPR